MNRNTSMRRAFEATYGCIVLTPEEHRAPRSKRTMISAAHKKKFASFMQLIEDVKSGACEKPEVLVVAYAWVLGDNYEELTTNLGLLAEAGIALGIAKPTQEKP